MNNYYYFELIETYLHEKDRYILHKNNYHIHAIQLMNKNRYRKRLLLDIFIHMGSPCIRRYCICHYFSNEDIFRAKYFT